jgi:hypothetical protein
VVLGPVRQQPGVIRHRHEHGWYGAPEKETGGAGSARTGGSQPAEYLTAEF